MTNILLAIIVILEATRLVLTHWKPSKKSHFKNKLEGVQKMIYDLEFKKFKTKEIREDIRKERDMMLARLEAINLKIKNTTGDDKAHAEDDKVLVERDVARFEAQIKQLDEEIYGAKPSADNHDGVTGITQQIDSLRELQGMLKGWIKQL